MSQSFLVKQKELQEQRKLCFSSLKKDSPVLRGQFKLRGKDHHIGLSILADIVKKNNGKIEFGVMDPVASVFQNKLIVVKRSHLSNRPLARAGSIPASIRFVHGGAIASEDNHSLCH